MNIFEFLTLKMINGSDWDPIFGESTKYKHWVSRLAENTCEECVGMHGKIWEFSQAPKGDYGLHNNCQCVIIPMETIKAGTATFNEKNGADWVVKNEGKLPNYYITKKEALKRGYKQADGNLSEVAPNMMLTKGIYKNTNKHLPSSENRVWYEADLNYREGFRNSQRLLFSNDGLIFVTFNHYKTFYEII